MELVSSVFLPSSHSFLHNFNESQSSEDAPFDENPNSDIDELVNHVIDLYHVFPLGFLWLPLIHWSSTG